MNQTEPGCDARGLWRDDRSMFATASAKSNRRRQKERLGCRFPRFLLVEDFSAVSFAASAL